MDQCPEKKELNLPRTPTFTLTHVQEIKQSKNKLKTFRLQISNLSTVLYSYIDFFKLHLKFDWFYSFFFSKCCCYFFHTLVRHGHIAPDYRLQNHIHTCLSHGDAPTRMQRGSGEGGKRLYENHPLLILGSCPKADPSLSSPSWSNFLFFLFYFLIFFWQNHRNQMCVPLEDFFRWDSHTDVTTWFLHDLRFDRPVLLCGDPLPELASDIPPAHQKKNHLGSDVLGLLLPGAWHLPAGHE